MKKLLTVAMLFCAVATVFAQGVNSVDQKGFNKVFASYSPANLSMVGTDVLVAEGSLNEFGLTYTRSQVLCKVPLYIEFGAGFQYMQKNSFRMYSAEVPVNIAYRLSLGKGKMHLTPFTGPYVRYNFSGSDDGIEESKFFSKDGYNRCQVGWQGGVAFSIKAFYLSLAYKCDFTNFIAIEGNYRDKINHNIKSGIVFGIGVVF